MLRLLITLATVNHWHLHQLDVNNAFLHGFLDDDIYMHPPPGFVVSEPGQVCKLVKSLYGLKQASREWNVEFCRKLFAFGFIQSPSDPCLFTKGDDQTFLGLIVYVDDVLIAGPSLDLITELKDYLHKEFTIKDLGVGIEIARSSAGIVLCQRKYVLDILSHAGLLDCKAASTPLHPGLILTQGSDDFLEEPDQYRRLVGQLLYLNFTRPDLGHATQHLSQFIARPTRAHWKAALHVLRYLKGCPSLGIFISSNTSLQVTAYSDADWGACLDTRRSLTAFCVFLGPTLISWRCKKQQTVSVSSAEAEYRALSSTTKELLWVLSLLKDLHVSPTLHVPLFCDNSAAIQNHVFHERTKHLDIDCHLVREKFKSGIVLPTSVPSTHQLADLLTKPHSGPRFQFLLSKLALFDLHNVQLEGG